MRGSFKDSYHSSTTKRESPLQRSFDDTSKIEGFYTSRCSSSHSGKPLGFTATKNLKCLLEEMDILRNEMEAKIQLCQNTENFDNKSEGIDFYTPSSPFNNYTRGSFIESNYLQEIKELRFKNLRILEDYDKENERHQKEKEKWIMITNEIKEQIKDKKEKHKKNAEEKEILQLRLENQHIKEKFTVYQNQQEEIINRLQIEVIRLAKLVQNLEEINPKSL